MVKGGKALQLPPVQSKSFKAENQAALKDAIQDVLDLSSVGGKAASSKHCKKSNV